MLKTRIKHADDEEGCWKQGLNMLMTKKDAENED